MDWQATCSKMSRYRVCLPVVRLRQIHCLLLASLWKQLGQTLLLFDRRTPATSAITVRTNRADTKCSNETRGCLNWHNAVVRPWQIFRPLESWWTAGLLPHIAADARASAALSYGNSLVQTSRELFGQSRLSRCSYFSYYLSNYFIAKSEGRITR